MRGRGERVRARRRPRRTPGPGWGWGWPRPQPLTPRSCLLLSPGAFAPPPHCAGGGPGARLTKRPPWGCVLLLVRGPVLVGPPPPRRHRLVPSTSGHFSPRPGGRRPLSRAGTFLSLEAPLRPGQRPQRFPARRSHGPPARRVPARPSPSPKTRLPSFVPKTRHRVIQL